MISRMFQCISIQRVETLSSLETSRSVRVVWVCEWVWMLFCLGNYAYAWYYAAGTLLSNL